MVKNHGIDQFKKKFKLKKIFIIFGITIFLILVTDYLFGQYILKFTTKKVNTSQNHSVYDHDLKKNLKVSLEWVPGKNYLLCTDQNSFRNFCDRIESREREFDIAFIGDSFTEGIGLNYEDTFVGKISNHLSDYKIANLGVVSYSPSIYFSKLKYLIDNGFKFKRVIIYYDISDVYDDNRKYKLIDNIVTRKKSIILSKVQKSLKSNFPYLSYSSKKIKNDIIPKAFNEKKIINKCNYLDFCHEKSSWTFNDNYFKDNQIDKSFSIMKQTFDLLKKNNIRMSVGIYPWPSQILYDNKNSKIVELMSDFCISRCEFFFNNFPDFFDELRSLNSESLISKYYFSDDVHFNKQGNYKLYKNFINTFNY